MLHGKFFQIASLLILQVMLVFSLSAQDPPAKKEAPGVAGIELGNRESAEKFLKDGYSPRLEADGRVSYSFYNKWANQVMRLFAPSIEDRYFITEAEVFRVGRSYQKPHFHAEEVKYFETESGVFIGFKQSAAYLIAGIKNAGKINEVKPKELIKMIGAPDQRTEEQEQKRETLTYQDPNLKLSAGDQESTAKYTAEYEFFKNKLKRFRLKIDVDRSEIAKKAGREK